MDQLAFIAVAALIGLILVAFIGLTLSRLWRRATPERAIVRTGGGKEFVTMTGGCFQIPVIHEITVVNMSTMRLDIERTGERSLITRDRKIRYWRPGLADITEALLGIDKALFGTPITPQRPSLEWPDGVSVDPEAQARTLQSLDQARAISIEQKVKTLHPDWEDDEVTEEVQRIMDENGMNVENPDTFTGLPPGPPQETNPAEQEVPA